jgi:CubicO group peptidase (beta-lactamase class C family)
MKAILCKVGLIFLFVGLPAALIAATADETPPAQQPKSVAAAVKTFVDDGTLAGAVMLVANKDKVLAVETVGWADIAAKIMMPLDALFWIASMSKPITAVALMMLVDDGKVKLDDPVDKYIPEFKNVQVSGEKLRKPSHPITVREVLSHTSGLPFVSPQETPTIDVLPLKEAVLSYTKTHLLFDPGTKYAYSNAGINTAGRIIEIASGMPYEEFLDKRLFVPLGMKDTTFWPSEQQMKRMAKSYKPGTEKKVVDNFIWRKMLDETKVYALKYPLTDETNRHPCPGGGLFSTADDCGIFCQMLLGGGEYKGKTYLSQAALKELSSRQTGKDMQSYGLGFAVDANGFDHGGAYATHMRIDRNHGLVTVWMVQHAGFPSNGGQAQGAFRKAAEKMYGAGK